MAPRTAYDAEFFRRQRSGSASTAGVVVPMVVSWVRPASVVDVGCGVGTWLAEFRRAGVEDVLGVDGGHVPPDLLEVPRDRVLSRDLARPLDLGRTFDLALSLEVAEHLPLAAADAFVASLAALAPVVLFSAAAPEQGGTGHVNEDWPEAWAKRFASHGLSWADPVRPRIWNRKDVEAWYAQNTILYFRPERFPTRPWDEAGTPSPPWPLPLVHPRLREGHGIRGVRRSFRDLRRSLAARIRGKR